MFTHTSPMDKVDINWTCSKDSKLKPRVSNPQFNYLGVSMGLSNCWSDWGLMSATHTHKNSCSKHLVESGSDMPSNASRKWGILKGNLVVHVFSALN